MSVWWYHTLQCLESCAGRFLANWTINFSRLYASALWSAQLAFEPKAVANPVSLLVVADSYYVRHIMVEQLRRLTDDEMGFFGTLWIKNLDKMVREFAKCALDMNVCRRTLKQAVSLSRGWPREYRVWEWPHTCKQVWFCSVKGPRCGDFLS